MEVLVAIVSDMVPLYLFVYQHINNFYDEEEDDEKYQLQNGYSEHGNQFNAKSNRETVVLLSEYSGSGTNRHSR